MDANCDEIAFESGASFGNVGDTKHDPGDAFEASGNRGLVNALVKVNSVGIVHK